MVSSTTEVSRVGLSFFYFVVCFLFLPISHCVNNSPHSPKNTAGFRKWSAQLSMEKEDKTAQIQLFALTS